VYGEAARFVARAQVDIGTVHDAAERVGQPTTVLPGGVDVSSIQSLPVGTRFHRWTRHRQNAVANQQQMSTTARTSAATQQRLSAPQQHLSASSGADPTAKTKQRHNKFKSRVVQRVVKSVVNKQSSNTNKLKRKSRRIAAQLASDNSMARAVTDSYVDDADETPQKGQSQEAFSAILALTETPGEQKRDGDGDSNDDLD